MIRLRNAVRLLPLCIAVVIPHDSQGQSALEPIEHFFAEPDIRAPQLSPDGTQLAFLTTLGTGKVGIALMHTADGKVEPLVAANDENIEFYYWKGNDHLVYAGDVGGNESPALRSFQVSKRKVLRIAESKGAVARVVDRLPLDPHHVLILGPGPRTGSTWDLWLLDVRNGQRRTVPVVTGALDVQEYVADNTGTIRVRGRFFGEKYLLEARPIDAKAGWVQIAEFPANDPRWSLLFFAADNENLYLLSNEKTDNAALHTLNLRTLQLSEPLFRPASGEIGSVLTNPDRSQLRGVTYVDDRTRYHWFDPDRARLQAQIDSSLPGTFNVVVSSSDDERLLVILATSDRDPGTYYVLDRRAPRLMALGKINSKLDPKLLRPMESVQFSSRDGLNIQGYLTRPAGDGPFPLIVHPHGGPFGIRDTWGFNPDVQFLASRGYAVLQINFRGSGGYGDSFLKAGRREWGGKMQDDLTDGVRWAIAQKIADPQRLAIYGASYGGYAALAGATFTPELYRCAINYVGVSDLNLITSWGRGRFGRSSDLFYREWVGDDRQYKFDRSPLNFVERIRIPTLHAYGKNDPRVDIDHWNRLEPKLKQFNRPYEVLIEQDEGHGFDNEAARLKFYGKVEEFLSRHLAPAVPDGSVHLGPARVVEQPARE